MLYNITVVQKTIFFLFILVINFFAVSGNFQNSIALVAGDDGVLTHVYTRANPERFQFDQEAQRFKAYTLTSLINWLPYFGYIWFQIDPIIFWYMFLFIQISLLPIATYAILYHLTKNYLASSFATILIVNVRPQMFNLSFSGDLEWMPYAGWMSLGLFLLSLIYFLNNKFIKHSVFVLLSGLVHPSFGLWTLLTSALMLIMSKKLNHHKNKERIVVLILVFLNVFNILRIFLMSTTLSADKPPISYTDSNLINAHFNAINIWKVDFAQYTITNGSILSLLGLLVIALINNKYISNNFSHNYNVILRSITFITLLGLSSQLAGVLLDSQTLLRTMGNRFTTVLAYFLFINFIAIYLRKNPKLDLKVFFILSLILVFPGGLTFFSISMILALQSRKYLDTKTRLICFSIFILALVCSARLVIWITQNLNFFTSSLPDFLSSLIQSHLFSRNYLLELFPLIAAVPIFFGIFLLLGISSKYLKNINDFFTFNKKSFFCLLIVISLLVQGRYANSLERFTLRDISFAELQHWVGKNTLPDASFFIQSSGITYSGWRNLTNRPKINLIPVFGPYGFYKSDFQAYSKYEENLILFSFAKLENPSFIFLQQNNDLFHIDFVVCDLSFETGQNTEVYRNQEFKIVRLNSIN